MTRVYLPFLLLVAGASSFAPNVQTVHRLAPLNVGATFDVDDESFWMEHAQSCANSDSCSLEENKVCLDKVLRIQSACSAGALIGDKVCEDVTSAAEIVANLRSKIDQQSQVMSSMMVGSTIANVSVLFCLFAVVATAGILVDPNAAPITPQEWWWSIRDGYFPLMLKEYYENGGLAGASLEATPFTLQEFGWAFKGGYLDTLFSQYFQHGGLPIDDSSLASTTPFTPQEWTLAAKDGYLPQILSQTFLNGGLEDAESSTLPITPQEWVWAAQGNYLGDLMKSFMENGGL
eukprot:CAMPEP_0113639290 /NCGR_PEP_ID=MMETSP0017_2-20120614/20608_1 /TAXON_ID=2856 /ORGANISM="Cylindrotheca closterium" /LENGTH=289 /DNA_ID=CAMNT_0000550489 /DNA_START=118 /DNA_END=987 /DNA_ORIENTATION=- /assembly_acc=CAM_ASM_000147